MAWGSRAGGQPGLSKLLWAPPENSTKLLCSFLAKMDPFFLICWCPPVRNIWFDLIVVSVPLPLSIPRPSSFLSLAKFSQTSSEPTHHTELGISCKLMFCRCSSCLTCWLSCPLLLRTVEKKRTAGLLPFRRLLLILLFMFSYTHLSTCSFHKRTTFCDLFCSLRSTEFKSSFPHLICYTGFRNCVWEVNGADWWQIPLIYLVPSSSCLIAVNQFISWLIFRLWLCCRFGGVREQPACASPSPGNQILPLTVGVQVKISMLPLVNFRRRGWSIPSKKHLATGNLCSFFLPTDLDSAELRE